MPFVVVTAAPLSPPTAQLQALSDVAATVAHALQLRPDDVQVSSVDASLGVLGDAQCVPWPIVILHGSARPAEHMAAAVAGARAAVAAAWQRGEAEVWCQWAATP